MARNPRIFRGEIWKVYNANRTHTREVIVVSNDKFNRFSKWYQVIPLDDPSSGFQHPGNVRICGKIVAIDLLTTALSSNFLEKKIKASEQEMQAINKALLIHLGLN